MVVNYKSNTKDIKKGLYLVSTPIGNLQDITFRAIETLKKSDYILCEDTRVSKNLLNKYEIKAKLISNHKFNEKKNISKIINLFKEDTIISLISDAGTPGISDPGAILVKECIRNNINIIPIPGASAVPTAFSISGFSEKFFFYGFFPEKKNEIIRDLEILSNLNFSLIFFISAKKLNKNISIIKKSFSGRKIIICREMTKFYEEFIRLEINELETFENDLKGELTIVISEKNDKKNSHELSESDKRNIKKMINKLSIKEITNFLNQGKKISKKSIYNYCLKLKNEI
jgi:16S rRNA (cytidine1402-2'-O)-methyltransferase